MTSSIATLVALLAATTAKTEIAAATMNATIATAAAAEGDFSNVVYETTWPVPETKVGHALIRVEASSVNPVDWKLIESSPPVYPKVLGFDVAGVMVGDGCAPRLLDGDRVWADLGDHDWLSKEYLELGAYGNFAVAHCDQVGEAPTTINATEAAVLPLVGLTAFQAYRMVGAPWSNRPSGPPVQDMVVVVTSGSGGTGHVALQMAKNVYSAGTVVTACSSVKLEFCESMGADVVVDYTVSDVFDTLDNDSVDIVFDNYGAPGTADKALSKLRTGGFFIFLPGKGGELSNATKEGVTQVNYGLTDSSNHSGSGLDSLKSMVDAGLLHGHVQQSFSLDQVADAFAMSFAGSVMGKLGIKVA